MSAVSTPGARVTRSYRQTIEASPDAVFPLLCPVREAEWLEGWRYTMVHSASGLVEPGAVFTTPPPGGLGADTVWIVTRHDAAAGAVEFARFAPGLHTCLLAIGVSPAGERRSHVEVAYTYTALAPEGERFIESFTEAAFLDAVVFWERAMNHFLKTGSRLARP